MRLVTGHDRLLLPAPTLGERRTAHAVDESGHAKLYLRVVFAQSSNEAIVALAWSTARFLGGSRTGRWDPADDEITGLEGAPRALSGSGPA